MRAIMTESTATFTDKKTGKKFSIMKRKFINNEPVHFIDFHSGKGWGIYEDKLNNGLTISEMFEQEVLS